MSNHITFEPYPTITWPSGDQIVVDNFQELCIYEAIDQPFMNGYITLIDMGILSRAVVGGEYLTIKMESEFEDEVIHRNFVIYGKTTEPVDERGVRAIKLLFVSEEALLAASKTFKQKWSAKISDIVKDVFEQLPLSAQPEETKKFESDESSIDFNYLAPNISGEDLLRLLQSICYDTDGYPFVLYENPKGFFFKSIKKLLDDYEEEPKYVYDNLLQTQSIDTLSLQDRALSITQVNVHRNFDLLSLVRRGAIASTVVGYDLLNREPVDDDYDILSRDPFDGDQGHPTIDEQVSDMFIGDGQGERIFLPVGEDQFMLDLAKNISFKRAVGNLMGTIKIEFSQVNAVHFHKVGDCINIEFDNQLQNDDNDDPTNELGIKLSGRYLITNVAHKLSTINAIKYDVDVGAVKLGYGEAL